MAIRPEHRCRAIVYLEVIQQVDVENTSSKSLDTHSLLSSRDESQSGADSIFKEELKLSGNKILRTQVVSVLTLETDLTITYLTPVLYCNIKIKWEFSTMFFLSRKTTAPYWYLVCVGNMQRDGDIDISQQCQNIQRSNYVLYISVYDLTPWLVYKI